MIARSDGKPRSDVGSTRKYASIEERDEARRIQRREANRRWRERNREALRERSSAYRAANRIECIERSQKWQRQNPDKVRDRSMARKYGLTLQQYNQLLEHQDGACAICGSEEKLVVDHCHATGAVRGILCDRCNVGIGCLNDDHHRLIAAADYLREGGHAGYAQLVADRLNGVER